MLIKFPRNWEDTFKKSFLSLLFCLTKKVTKKSRRQKSHRTTASASPAAIAPREHRGFFSRNLRVLFSNEAGKITRQKRKHLSEEGKKSPEPDASFCQKTTIPIKLRLIFPKAPEKSHEKCGNNFSKVAEQKSPEKYPIFSQRC